jgi:site-specific DNA recombinase
MTKPWAIYTRVSTDDQAREGTSLGTQAQAAADMLRMLGHPRGEVFEDAGHSAKDLHRPAAARMLALVDAGELAGVIVYKLDRLTRSVADLQDLLQRFDASGTALVSVREHIDTTTAMGRFFVGLIGLIAQWEREQISERVTVGIHARKAAGGFYGGAPPTGLVAEGPPGGRVLVTHPEHGPIVAQAWTRCLGGASLRDLAEWLTAQGIRNRRGAWTASGAHVLLTNQRYIGRLVDRETFDRVAAVLEARHAPGKVGAHRTSSRTQTHSTRTWPLTGIARCGSCQSPLIGVTATNAQGKAFPYLRCSGRARKGRTFCQAKDLPAEPWEAAIMANLMAAVESQGELLPAALRLAKQVDESAEPLREQQRVLTMARDAATQRLRNLTELASAGGAAARGLLPGIVEAQGVLEEVEGKLASLEGQLAAAAVIGQRASEMVDALREGLGGLLEASPEDQATQLRAVLTSATIYAPTRVGELGRIDLGIRLPDLPEFVRPLSMVVLGSRRTNPEVLISQAVAVPSLKDWRAQRPPA